MGKKMTCTACVSGLLFGVGLPTLNLTNFAEGQ